MKAEEDERLLWFPAYCCFRTAILHVAVACTCLCPYHLHDMSSLQMRQRIRSEFRKQQLMLDKEALALLVDYVEQAATGLDAVYTIIEKLEAGTKL